MAGAVGSGTASAGDGIDEGLGGQDLPFPENVWEHGAHGGRVRAVTLVGSDRSLDLTGDGVPDLAVGATEAYVCVKASFEQEREALTRAVQEMQEAGLCDDCTVTVVAGPDEYLFGEEKAMLEVIEGKPPLPRLFPPYEHGLFATAPQLGWESTPSGGTPRGGANPTLVNNVETLSNVPHILAKGVDWFRSMGTEESPGTIVTTVVGDVVAPDVGEVEMGTPLSAVIDAVGSGVSVGRTVKAVFSGVANAVITGEKLDTPLTYEHMAAAGAGLGAGGYIVYDDSVCMVEVACTLSRFLYVESCGQCPPCKLGTGQITEILDRIRTGKGVDADLAEIEKRLRFVTDGNRCFLPVQERSPASCASTRPTSPPTSRAGARRSAARSATPRSSTWSTGWSPGTTSRPGSAPTGPTPRSEPALSSWVAAVGDIVAVAVAVVISDFGSIPVGVSILVLAPATWDLASTGALEVVLGAQEPGVLDVGGPTV